MTGACPSTWETLPTLMQVGLHWLVFGLAAYILAKIVTIR